MNDTQRRINRFMRDEGFQIVSTKGKHYKWSNGTIEVICPKSVSDHRAYKNKICQVKRLKRQGKSRDWIGGIA